MKFIKIVINKSVIIFLLSFFSAVQVHAASPAEQLQSLLQRFQTFEADFDQITLAESGRTAQKTTGHLQLAKPDRFRWETRKPLPQEIVSDGQYIWIYDPDLEQVTRRPAGGQQGSAPAQILNGQIENLLADYRVEHQQTSAAEQVFVLQAVSAQTAFSSIRLTFNKAMMAELMLEDSLGQRTTIVFHNARQNPSLPAEAFLFRVPAGVDLIIDAGE